MGVGVTCPKCSTTFAFYCNKCSSYDTAIYKGFVPENYFQSRTAFYLKCKSCKSEFDFAICPDCKTKIMPTAPFVRGDSGGNRKGCFIATACLGKKSPILAQLYVFRDELLAQNNIGQKFIKYYYIYSPYLSAWILHHKMAKSIVKFLVVYPTYCLSLAAMKIYSFLKKDPDR